MKVVFISNYFNHHQAPFSEAMYRLTKGQYWFIATEKMTEERKSMGWGREQVPGYVLESFSSQENLRKAKELILESDVAVFGLHGWSNFQLIQPRLKRHKLTFRYSERIYKGGVKWYRLPVQAVKLWLVGGRYDAMNMLCASAYTAQDYARTRSYVNRTYKWGYFPAAKRYDPDELMNRKLSAASGGEHPRASILWAGRLIAWKHPEASVELAAALRKKGYDFRMSIIGNGEMETQLRSMIRERKLEDCVEMLGAMSPDEVRSHMERADIFLFTSDFNEGWGAVLNESMNSGCAVVASHAIGSVPFLIRDGENGLIYQNGNQRQLEERVCRLLDDGEFRRKLAREAYRTISGEWNAECAAERLLLLAGTLMAQGKAQCPFGDGLCSRAAVLPYDVSHGE